MEHSTRSTNLAEILERVLDKGLVIAGDIKISLADVELLSIKIRLLVASVDKAREIGINWWEDDPELNTKAKRRHEKQKLLEEQTVK
ncbi:Gas vesicle protein [Desulfotomaculum arcticum]|uniref:Gas vesicle protein n=1 Tax=Desulfotruncus arcticus DSM 17038 TaxID=1121424 RepID=A0A1I2VH06_9FIRM|nr:gas vesicle protein [Desulfotruncus arcticus]SFG88568.1 Gas vesicle protein [Desulfotomaculum arcticum] [Desulfotruncus arcticus DSM 17038]